ncbi:MAG TPA: DUF1707 domain-containing protein [Solirubrobacteraceae bacterium]|jgi:hypothetical protein|nr:DUF1707 domain-containing protein [Solirubrobacteraceae bacterium]
MYDDNPSQVGLKFDANLRVGDADREATAERLRHHHAEGRIDVDEFGERLGSCYQATTAGQLRELVGDLPPEPQRTPRYRHPRRLIPVVPILVAILLVSLLTDHDHHGFPFLLLFLVFPLARFFLWRGSRTSRR